MKENLRRRAFRAALLILLIVIEGMANVFAQTQGALNGLFSVSATKKVYFSQGNLQYQASTNTFRFAPCQFEAIGMENSNISSTYTGWIDLFGWGTSGYNHGAYYYQPWSYVSNTQGYNAYGSSSYHLYDQTGKADWGYNAISNGGDAEKIWRTLTNDEWNYLLKTRINAGKKYGFGTIGAIPGLIILPDSWVLPSGLSFKSGTSTYTNNVYTIVQWESMETAGAVFLPVTGFRNEKEINSSGLNGGGFYWSSTTTSSNMAYFIQINSNTLTTSYSNYADKFTGRAVRLVLDYVFYTVTATANSTEGGTVTGSGSYAKGASCTLTAIPASDYTFVNWTENGEVISDEVSYTFTVTEERSLVANFEHSIINHWIPESSAYSDNMALNGVIQIDGVEQYSDMLEVGAFCGDECRGSAIATLFDLTQHYIITMTVYGEAGHQLTFKLFDHSIEEELDLVSPAEVVFDVNGYGSPVSPYILNFTSAIQTQTTPLVSGWNWYSTYIEQNGIDGLAMLENSLGENGLRIQGRTAYVDQFEYQGDYYWYGTLDNLANEEMYKVRTNAACNAVLEGHLASVRPITINNGWNWIGYPLNHSVTVTQAMADFTPEADDMIKGRNGYATFVVYGDATLWYGTLNTLEPGRGYMYKSNSTTSKTLTFQSGREEDAVADFSSGNNIFSPNDGEFANNMVVTAIVEKDGKELRSEDYELAAFVGEECRGSVKLMYVEPFDKYVAFLLVYGDEVEDIHFALTNGDETMWSNDVASYSPDGIVGTLSAPSTLHFDVLGVDDNEAVNAVVYPNPSCDVFNIKCEGVIKMEVFNAYGQVVLKNDNRTNSQQIDLSNYASGTYMLRIVTGNGIVMKKLFKK